MIAKPPLRWLTSGSHGSDDTGHNDENGSGDDAKARVLAFDPKVRERLQQREGAQAQGPQWKGVSPAMGRGKGMKSNGAAAGAKPATPTKVRVFQVLQVVGVVFALVVFMRSCGIGF